MADRTHVRTNDPDQLPLFARGRVAVVPRMRRQCDVAVTRLRRADRLAPDRPDLIAAARTLAEWIDREARTADPSPFTVARLLAEYRATVAELSGAAPDLTSPFAFDDSDTPLRDTAPA